MTDNIGEHLRSLPKMIVASICSVCSRKYLPQSLTMTWSVQRHSQNYSFHLFLTDVTEREGAVLQGKFPGIDFRFIDQFADDPILANALRLSDLEFNVSLKARALREVLEETERKTLYCDSDLYFLREPEHAVQMLSEFDIVLTPHQIDHFNDEADFAMLRTGVFNSGFIGVKGSGGHAFARWWEQKLLDYCLLEPEEGIFVDQKWLDLVPGLFSSVLAIRDPGYNLGYWNLNARGFDGRATFLHLSGLDLRGAMAMGEALSGFSDVTIAKDLAKVLIPYRRAYEHNREKIANLLGDESRATRVERVISQERCMVARRSLPRRWMLRFENGEPVLQRRRNFLGWKVPSLFRRPARVISVTRFIGKLLIRLRLGFIVELLLPLCRILGRRSNWVN